MILIKLFESTYAQANQYSTHANCKIIHKMPHGFLNGFN